MYFSFVHLTEINSICAKRTIKRYDNYKKQNYENSLDRHPGGLASCGPAVRLCIYELQPSCYWNRFPDK
ncbi:hypothetical protein CWM47_26110 [Spirosoma pollinicola]|uniref:Uncharacterized protein n=1 Tax=Spirosoma pollinicola TaxID=2057025 RepID=A0A2K8Z544_9BACT|nr:hypothetical protein CWM47_26110 [Spirosoma pollinicola]